MRHKKTIEMQSVRVKIAGVSESPVRIIPEGIIYKKGTGWILNTFDVDRGEERQIVVSLIRDWRE